MQIFPISELNSSETLYRLAAPIGYRTGRHAPAAITRHIVAKQHAGIVTFHPADSNGNSLPDQLCGSGYPLCRALSAAGWQLASEPPSGASR